MLEYTYLVHTLNKRDICLNLPFYVNIANDYYASDFCMFYVKLLHGHSIIVVNEILKLKRSEDNVISQVVCIGLYCR